MHKAWRRAVERLADCVQRKLEQLQSDDQVWQDYIEIGRSATEERHRGRTVRGQSGFRPGYRTPSAGAQPVFLERMLVRVIMHREMVQRRTTERDVIACEDGVDGFDVLASTSRTADLSELPIKAIWACRLAAPRAAQSSDPTAARLKFRKTLHRGERYHFISEAWDDHLGDWQTWINVDVDHHGIAPGALDEDGRPIAGLTMQVSFERHCLPQACWWYAEQTDLEKRRRPRAGDPRLIEVGDGFVEHTFAGQCQPRESYGIAFKWSHE
jgi:hypothetical protein